MKNLQQRFNVFIQSAGTLEAQVSGTDCFDLVYQSMQRPRYGAAAAASVYYPFTFALFEVPLAWMYHYSYLAGLVLNPSSTPFSCPTYDDSYTLAETLGQGPFQQFDLTRVLASGNLTLMNIVDIYNYT